MKYPRIQDDEWVRPRMKGWRLMCCDCGLVHEIEFRVDSRGVKLRGRRNARATAAARKGLKT